MFIGRIKELLALNERYNSGRFEFIPIYGRRRVGKTALIKEFIKDKKAIFFTATMSGKNHNLKGLSSAIVEVTSSIEADLTFSSYEAALDAVYKIANKEKIVFVIDEYPYLAQGYKPISSILQTYIDHKFKETDMFIILCGSSMSFMEYQVLGYKSPLYGRRTGQLKILPFDFKDSAMFHANFTKEEKAVIYGITGGIPKYLEMIYDTKSLKNNIISNFLTADTMLFEEPANLLKQELREPQTYNDIITAVAGGSSKMNEIVTKVNIDEFDSGKCNKYLQSLISIGIIKKEQPILNPGRKSIYRLNDNMFRFWYRFIPQNISKIHLGLGEAVYQRIESQINAYMGEVFESICKEWLWSEYIDGRLPIALKDCGRWWGANPITKKEQEIDIIGVSEDNNELLLCECKWTEEKVGSRALEDLKQKSAVFNVEKKHYILFSKSGFTDELKSISNNVITLVEFSDM